MARSVKRGEVWQYAFKRPDKKRPVLILTRDEVIGLLNTVTVAPITSTIHGAPSEVLLGIEEGLKHTSAANLDHLQTVAKAQLQSRIGRVSQAKLAEACRAARIALGCD